MQGLMGVGPISKEERALAQLEDREPVASQRFPRTDFPKGLLHGILWERVILDEAHRLRKDGNFARSCYALQRRNCTLVTGTPQQNDFLDWYPLVNMLRRPYAGIFKKVFGGNRHRNAEWSPLERRVAVALGIIVRGLCVRRMNNSQFNGLDVLKQVPQEIQLHDYFADDGTEYKHGTSKLGGKTEKDAQDKLRYLHTRWALVPKSLKREWERVHSMKPERAIDQEHIFAELLLARQAAIHPSIHLRKSKGKMTSGPLEIKDWRNLMTEGDNWRSSHLDTVVEIVGKHLDDPESGGLIIFSQYIAPLDLAEIAIKKRFNRECLRYDGSVSDKQKLQNMKEFQKKHSGPPLIMLMTSGSAAEGHNIPQANRCIILGPSFNPYVDVQAWYRVLRRGQLRPCYLHILILYGSYEYRQVFIQDRKVDNAESILNLNDQDIADADNWDEEEFQSLVSRILSFFSAA